MDNTILKPYSDALSAQKAQLEGVVARGFKAIAIPADVRPLESKELHFLGKSAVAFGVLGVAGFILGLIVGSMGIVIAGCAALLSAGYLYVKGRQADRADAFVELSDQVYGKVADIASQVADQWKSFTSKQNDSLKLAIVNSTASDADKVQLIDRVDASPAVRVDLDSVRQATQSLGAQGEISAYNPYLVKLQSTFQSAIDSADTAQQQIYTNLAK